MATKCDFCQKMVKDNYKVNEVVIDKNPGIIRLMDVLLDLFFCELDVSKICPNCLDTISKQFIFKQKLRKNLKMPQSNIIIQISKFLSKNTKEEANFVSENFDILTIYPSHRKKFVETIQMLSPEVIISNSPPVNSNRYDRVKQEKNIPTTMNLNSNHKSLPAKDYKSYNQSSSSSDGNDSDDSNYNTKKSPKRKRKNKLRHQIKAKKQKIIQTETVTGDKEISQFSKRDNGIKRISKLCNTSRLESKLNQEQNAWLNQAIESTEKHGKIYYCKFCFKALKSALAIRYHYINRHLFKSLSNKQVWISNKLKEGLFQVKREGDGKKVNLWRCVECSKIYNNQPGMRYHLTKHLNEECD